MNLTAAWFWPDVNNRRFAQNAIQEAFWAAVLVSTLTAIFTVILLMDQNENFVSPVGFINSAVFGGLAFGIYRRSRIAASSAFLLFAGGTILQFATTGPSGWIFRGFIALAFFHGMRGTVAYHKLPALPASLPSIEQSFQTVGQSSSKAEKNLKDSPTS